MASTPLAGETQARNRGIASRGRKSELIWGIPVKGIVGFHRPAVSLDLKRWDWVARLWDLQRHRTFNGICDPATGNDGGYRRAPPAGENMRWD